MGPFYGRWGGLIGIGPKLSIFEWYRILYAGGRSDRRKRACWQVCSGGKSSSFKGQFVES